MKIRLRLSLLMVVGIYCSTALSHELETSIGAESEYFDNILQRDGDNPSDDLLSTLFLGFNYKYRFSNLEADFEYTARKLDYRDDTFDDRTDVVGTTTVNYEIVPRRFNWNLLYIRDRVLSDRANLALPSNEQDRKTFSSGPELRWNFGGTRTLFFRGNYVDSRAASRRSFQSTQTRGEWQYLQRLGGYTFSLSSLRSNVNVVESDRDYNQQRYTMSLSGAAATMKWDLSLGRNIVKRQTGGSTAGLFYSGSLSMQRKDFLLSLNSNRQLTDSQLGLSLNNNIQDVDDNGDGGLRDFDIVERTRHELSLAYNGTQTSVVYNFTRDHQDYQTLNQDESTQTTSVTLRYRQSASASWSFRMARTTSTFQVPGAADTRFRQYNRRLTWDVKLNTDLSTQTWIGFDRRRSDAGTTSYKDETIGVRLTYRI